LQKVELEPASFRAADAHAAHCSCQQTCFNGAIYASAI